MDNIHFEKILIPTASAGGDKKIRFSALLGLMQDAASTHASKLGIGYDQLIPIHRTFMLSRMELHVLREMPEWGQSICLQTWARKLDRLLAYRDFSLSVEGDLKPFLSATSAWLLIDTRQRRPARPHEALLSIQTHPTIAVSENAPERITRQQHATIVCTRRAYHSDLDPNGHVNNTRYFDWITDALAEHMAIAPQIEEFSINFLKEIQYGEEVSIAVKPIETNVFYIEGVSGKQHHFSSLIKVH